MSDASSGAMAPPPSKKVRSCNSSESTPNISSESYSTPGLSITGVSSLDETTAATLIDAARRYEIEA
eukprot:CAMPEP_0201738500 /NCGR_PEP_ID=MMETSP0593-20130828/45272_1 /ASSEMBLY_ACC=CAM_ASM_000672 /TAXON_ID=267983 /ORGANISM="Skeletonema japonicum, Strain CCMP2506" /LENGTH=66 /DNA_ID=CAMNT_0048232719 /DNA_START=99 /DNA_END=296 /DNA_ORIENTATION=+